MQQGSRLPHSEIDGAAGRIDPIVAVYLVAATAWILGTGWFAGWVADHTPIAAGTVELVKGLLFVVFTGLVLRASLHRWASRLGRSAVAEAHAAQVQAAAAARLREAEAVRTRFLRGVSHELRTPLTNVIGFAMTIRAHLDRASPESITAYADRLVVNARRLEQLVLDLVDLDRMSQDDVRGELVALDRFVEACVAQVAHDGHIVSVSAPPVRMRLDRGRTARLLHELVRNAVRHTPQGTHVWVRAEHDPLGVRFVVEDDGPGVPAELGPAVFEAFTQGASVDRAASPGLGIGLALVERYAQAQDGSVHLTGRPGGGARFVVWLPLRGPIPIAGDAGRSRGAGSGGPVPGALGHDTAVVASGSGTGT